MDENKLEKLSTDIGEITHKFVAEYNFDEESNAYVMSALMCCMVPSMANLGLGRGQMLLETLKQQVMIDAEELQNEVCDADNSVH